MAESSTVRLLPMRTTAAVLMLLAATCTGRAQGAGLSGTWAPAAGAPAAEVFSLTLLVRGDAVCGKVMATSHGATHIDDSMVVGRRRGAGADLVFTSRQGTADQRGRATVRIDGHTLQWRVTQPVPGADLWPAVALRRQERHGADERAALRIACEPHWGAIARGDAERIDLRGDADPAASPAAADPERTREALGALLAVSAQPIPVRSTCAEAAAPKGLWRVGDLLAVRLAYLDRGANVVEGACRAHRCEVVIRHAAGEDVASAQIRFERRQGRAVPESLQCVLTP